MLEEVHNLRSARQLLKEYQHNHISLWEDNLKALAEARIVAKNPSLLQPQKLQSLEKRITNEIHRIKRKEAPNKQCTREITRPSIQETCSRVCNRLIHPHQKICNLFLEGPDPKTWTGPWRTVSNPEEMAAHVCAANARQYRQAHSSPFCSKPLLSNFGYCVENQGSKDLVSGTVPPAHIMNILLPETQNICTTLANFHQQITLEKQRGISPEAFVSLYIALDERTSSSPSERHLGHYKAANQAETLARIHSQLMSIPNITVHSPIRWYLIVDIMLEKRPGDHRIHRLKIIALQESDFNQVNHLALGRPVQHKLEDSGLLPDMQHVSCSSKQCHSTVLNKVLTFEIKRYMKQPIAYIENDAMGCFDCITNPLVLIFFMAIGVSPSTL
jgi:hypothetical protein